MTKAAGEKAYKALQIKYTKQVTRQVTRGVRFLDAELPDWVERADVSTLNLENSECCMLGQAHENHYSGGLDLLASVKGLAAKASDYGFNLPAYVAQGVEDLALSDSPFWSILQEEWNSVLVKRICALTSQKAKDRLAELYD